MKKVAAILLTVVLLLSALPLTALATDMQASTDDRGRLVDIVILVDHSRSMNTGNGRGNDINNNRYNATAMITAMCDMNGSRVAFVPFSNKNVLTGSGYEGFISMSTLGNANALRQQIEATARKALEPATDYGSALAYAYNLFENRDDEAKANNNPMIILLTDGSNDMRDLNGGLHKRDPLYLWNPSTERYQEVPLSSVSNLKKTSNIAELDNLKNLLFYDGTPLTRLADPSVLSKYDQAQADMLVKDVAARCAEKGIPIYTIPLYGDDDKFVADLQAISVATNAMSNPLSAKNADRLPSFFGDVFADQIGSTQRPLTVKQSSEEGFFEVDIPILNRSVQEANIYIPLTYVDPDSITLIDSNGRTRMADNSEIVRITYAKAFVLYKLRATNTMGTWHLRFKPNRNGISPSSINFSLLYNYDLTLVTTTNGSATGATISKSDTLNLVSTFYDNKTQAPTDDTALYTATGDDGERIAFTYRLLASNKMELTGAQAIGGEMAFDTFLQAMGAAVPLAGHDLREGDYYVQIIADGAGLHRENLIPLTLRNQNPVATSLTRTYRVEDVNDPASYAPQPESIDLSDLVTDPDGDPLTIQGVNYTAGSDIVNVQVSGTKLTVTPLKGANQHYNPGTASGTIDVIDNDGGSCQIPFSITVSSGWYEAMNGQYPTVVESGLDDAGVAAKNSEVVFSMTPASGTVDRLQGSLVLQENGQDVDTLPMTADGNALKVTLKTLNTKANWNAHFVYTYNNEEVASVDIPVTVNNQSPKAIPDAESLFPSELTFNASIYSALISEDPQFSIDLKQLFTDPDNELGLQYSVAPKNDTDQDKLGCAIDGATLTLTALSSGKVPVVITAKDGDGLTDKIEFTVSVVDLFLRWTIRLAILLAAIILLIIVIIALYQRSKPRFPETGALHVTVGNSLFDRNTQPDFSFHKLNKPKEPITLNAIITLDTSDEVQFKHAELGFIRIRPIKASNDLLVEMTKKPTSFTVRLDDNDLKVLRVKTPFTLNPNHELTLYREGDNSPENCVHLTYTFSSTVQDQPSNEELLTFTPINTGTVAGDDLPNMGGFDPGLDAGLSGGMDSGFGNDAASGFGSADFGSDAAGGFGSDAGNGFGGNADSGFGGADFGGDTDPFGGN